MGQLEYRWFRCQEREVDSAEGSLKDDQWSSFETVGPGSEMVTKSCKNKVSLVICLRQRIVLSDSFRQLFETVMTVSTLGDGILEMFLPLDRLLKIKP